MSAPAGDRSALAVILLCFFLSGATGLVYQVIWLRLLGLVLGHTVYATTTVLAAFMAGLALGSLLFARWAARIRSPIAAYGWLEIAIGISCALVPLLLSLVARAYLALHASLRLSYDAFSLVQFAMVSALLIVPTTLMGATLPVLSQALARNDLWPGRTVGALYAVNSFGAVAGTTLAGYVLLPALGNRTTIALAVIANVAVGLLALAYSRRAARGSMPAEVEAGNLRERAEAPPETRPAASLVGARLTVLALGVSGAVSMVYEVSWTRAISLVIGSSTYAFTAMLVAFLAGIAGGSALYSWLWGSRHASPAAFALIQTGIATASVIALLFFERMPEIFIAAFRWSASIQYIQVVQFALSVAALLPFTLFIGATFPCAIAVAARGAAHIGRDVGNVYAVNTVGAIIGALVTGFGLIPAVGVSTAIKIGIAVNLGLAAILFLPAALPAARTGPGVWRWSGSLGLAAAAVAVFALPGWDHRVLSSGSAVYAQNYLRDAKGGNLAGLLRRQEILFYRDGLSGTVSVNRVGRDVFLRVNGKVDAGTSGDMPTQLMSGHLPMLLHRDPRAALVIGMGSGITVGAVLRHPVELVDVVEVEPAVLEASRFFTHVHGDPLRDSRVRPILADGRNYLFTTRERYDVIISEPSNPWIGGLASLFSVEFFDLARSRLRPGGLMLQWLQGYNLFPDDLRMVVATFRHVFPWVTVWNAIGGDYLLLGSTEPQTIDLIELRRRHERQPGIARDYAHLGIDGWASPMGYFVLGSADTERLAHGAGLNTDDRLPLEFRAPRALYTDTVNQNARMVRGFQSVPLPEVTRESRPALQDAAVLTSIASGHLGRWDYAGALTHLREALRLAPDYPPALVSAGSAELGLGRPAVALELAEAAIARWPDHGEAYHVAGLACERLGALDRALGFLSRAVALEPRREELVVARDRVRQAAGR